MDQASSQLTTLYHAVNLKFDRVQLSDERSSSDEEDNSCAPVLGSPVRPDVKLSKKQHRGCPDNYSLFLMELKNFQGFLTNIEREMGTRLLGERLSTNDDEINKEITMLQVCQLIVRSLESIS